MNNIAVHIRQENKSRGRRPAVIEPTGQWSYDELLEEVRKLRQSLPLSIIRPGCRIAFQCEDGFAFIVGSLALLEAGSAIVPIDNSLPQEEVERILTRMQAHGFLYRPESETETPDDPLLETGVNHQCRFRWRPLAVDSPPTFVGTEGNLVSPAFIRFSSGTTGASKGVVLSHKTIFERTDAADKGLKITAEDRVLWVLQMSHHFVVSILLFLRRGAAIILGSQDFPRSLEKISEVTGVTFIYASPFHYQLLAADDNVAPSSLNQTRLALSTAMKLPAETAGKFAEKFGFNLAQAYGIIEIGLPFINLNPNTGSRDSVGQLLPDYELWIKEPDSRGIGRVFIRGPGMFDAYFSPWQPRNEVLEDGWFNTGDLGRLDERGNLEIVGREKNVIICAGMKIFPEEVEELLNSHPSIEESMVYGAENSLYGQIPHARVVLTEEPAEMNALQQELRRYCYTRLPSYKVPKSFIPTTALPRTVSGKIQRRR